MSPKTVLTTDLMAGLKELRQSFLVWDNQRRLKVDIVLAALDEHEYTVDLDKALHTIDMLAQQNPSYRQLAPAAQKMLKLEYLELARSENKIKDDHERHERARLKLENFKKKGLL